MGFQQTFADRRQAGRELAAELTGHGFVKPVVLALPRGGVPVAYEIAIALQAPLDLAMAGKIGAPRQSEFAIGAVFDGENPQLIIDSEAAKKSGADEAYLASMKGKKLAALKRRRRLYGIASAQDLKGRTAIVVDDGIATGLTAKAALMGIASAHPERIVLAVPVAAPDSLQDIAPLCDEVVSLLCPEPFYAVGEHYDEFGQTSDAEVMALLKLANEIRPNGN